MTQQFVCIVCPVCCRLSVEEKDGQILVRGNGCPRGKVHGTNEFRAPMRMLTTTIALKGGRLRRLPVISSQAIPKQKVMECLRTLYKMKVQAPVQAGQVIAQNLCGSGADIVAARTIPGSSND